MDQSAPWTRKSRPICTLGAIDLAPKTAYIKAWYIQILSSQVVNPPPGTQIHPPSTMQYSPTSNIHSPSHSPFHAPIFHHRPPMGIPFHHAPVYTPSPPPPMPTLDDPKEPELLILCHQKKMAYAPGNLMRTYDVCNPYSAPTDQLTTHTPRPRLTMPSVSSPHLPMRGATASRSTSTPSPSSSACPPTPGPPSSRRSARRPSASRLRATSSSRPTGCRARCRVGRSKRPCRTGSRRRRRSLPYTRLDGTLGICHTHRAATRARKASRSCRPRRRRRSRLRPRRPLRLRRLATRRRRSRSRRRDGPSGGASRASLARGGRPRRKRDGSRRTGRRPGSANEKSVCFMYFRDLLSMDVCFPLEYLTLVYNTSTDCCPLRIQRTVL
jgi:hypothetical protein